MLAVVALILAAVGLVLGLMSVLPTPNLGVLELNVLLDVVAMLAEELSLWVAIVAVLGLILAVVARVIGWRKTPLVAAALAVVAIVLSMVPVVQGLQTASKDGVALSLSQYFSVPPSSQPETVTYARPEGQELKLDINLPADDGGSAGSQRRPAVVMVHGGGGVEGGRSEEATWSAWLAQEGYAVFSIDYRLGLPPRWQDATGDVKCAIGWVQENADSYGVDPDRIALMGRSAGGLFSLLAAYTEGDPQLPPSCDVPDTGVEAVIAFYAPTDLTRPDESPWWRPQLGNAAKDATGAAADFVAESDRGLASPTSHVDPGDPPTFLAHGSHDQFSAPQQSVLLADRLEEEVVSHRLLEVPGARHAFDSAWGGWNQQIVAHELGEFLEDNLAG
ncbi:alpha/beta hydrolase fold domain-containing protein [Agromyces bauzanensis]